MNTQPETKENKVMVLNETRRETALKAAKVNRTGIDFSSLQDMFTFAEIMAKGVATIPKHLQGNTADCLAICHQAVKWGLDPYYVANQSYFVNGVMAFQSQIINAVMRAQAPIEGGFDVEYDGEGPEKRCKIVGVLKSDGKPREYLSPPLSKIKGKSSLWENDPEQQLFYFASRSWVRRWCPEILGGYYAFDEMQHVRDITPKGNATTGLAERLAQAKTEKETSLSASVENIIDAEYEEHDGETGELIEALSKDELTDSLNACQSISELRATFAAPAFQNSYKALSEDDQQDLIILKEDRKQVFEYEAERQGELV